MELGVHTTVAFCAAATSSSLGLLGVYMGHRRATRHFRHAAVAAFAGALYCLTDAVQAGRASEVATVWSGMLGGLALCIHGASVVVFLAAWAKRPLSKIERALVTSNVVCAVLALVPELVAGYGVTDRSIDWLGITYREPHWGPLGVPCVLLSFGAHVAATLAAIGMARTNHRARAVAVGLGSLCVIFPLDMLSTLGVLSLPNLADVAFAVSIVCVGGIVVVDAAESVEKSAALEEARLALAERDNLAALGQLAAVVAHEVRNPVAIIFGALVTLRKTLHSEQDASLLAIVDEEATRLQQLVTRLLDVVRPFELQYSEVPAERILQLAIAQGTSGAASEVAVTSPDVVVIECDELLLVQAISNLVQNAVLASGRRSPVRVCASVEGASPFPMFRVEVADDGDGVRPEARARLFTPFFTTRATGTGLGLALVKRIAGAHGGTVDHRAPDEGGACFVLRVPLRAGAAKPRRLIGSELT